MRRSSYPTSAATEAAGGGETTTAAADQNQHQHADMIETSTKKKRNYQRDSHPDEQLIMKLKLHLDKLQRERQYKNAAVAAKNALKIEDDEAARDLYRRNHKTEEELFQDWLEETKKLQALEREAFEREQEAPVRAAIEEEWQLERQLLDQDNNLSFFTFVVDRNVAHYKKRERQEVETKLKLQSSSDALQRDIKLLEESWREGASAVEREEKGSRRSVLAGVAASAGEAQKRYIARAKQEAEEKERREQEAVLLKQKQLDEEVDDMEAAFEARLARLAAKFS